MMNVLARYQTKIYFEQNQSSYYSPHSDWNMTLNIKNVFDRLRFNLIGFLGLVNSNKGEERRILLEFNYAFDR